MFYQNEDIIQYFLWEHKDEGSNDMVVAWKIIEELNSLLQKK